MARRLRTVPAVIVGGALFYLLLIPGLILGALFDLGRGRVKMPTPRVTLFGAYYLAWEWYVLTISLVMWFATGFGRFTDRPWSIALHRRLQVGWANGLLNAMHHLLHLRVEIDGAECVAPGPVIVFCRHASIIDTLLPAHILSTYGGLALRYVLKHELLMDPMLDIVGNRIPNHFVDRSGHNTRAELDAIAALAAGTGPQESFTIFPEGSRFTPEKRDKAIAKLETIDPGLAVRAKGLQHTMPPRPGGPLAILSATPGVDVVFMAHTGLEGLNGVRDAWRTVPFRNPVKVTCWRVAADDIPAGDPERVDWLFAEWSKVDDWIDEHRAHSRPTGAAAQM